MRSVHKFDSSVEAYHMTQCDETIKNGDILYIPSEQVIGIADTWPFAITKKFGSLHHISPCEAGDKIREEFAEDIEAAKRFGASVGYIDTDFAS